MGEKQDLAGWASEVCETLERIRNSWPVPLAKSSCYLGL